MRSGSLDQLEVGGAGGGLAPWISWRLEELRRSSSLDQLEAGWAGEVWVPGLAGWAG